MKTPEQLKGSIRNISKEKKIHPQTVLQMFMFERIVERLSVSSYKKNFILKGGLLISSMVGIAERVTMDMDTTVKGIHMDESEILKVVVEILKTPLDDGIEFLIKNLAPIREADDYKNFRVSLVGVYGKMRIPLKIDITTGDEITPEAIVYQYSFLFEEKTVPIMAYTIETILAEKYETIIRRNLENTRARDFYDLHILSSLYAAHPDWNQLKRAVKSTAEKRGSFEVIKRPNVIIESIEHSEALKEFWKRYASENDYAAGIAYEDIMKTVKSFCERILF